MFDYTSYQTPYYLYDLNVLGHTLDTCMSSFNDKRYVVHYAIKANINDPILERIKRKGLGIDCVSGNEVAKALDFGFDPKKIALAGVGKTDKEIKYAIEQEIGFLIVESVQELDVIEALASQCGKRAPLVLRINPKVHAYTHSYISTALEKSKFGIATDELDVCVDKIKQSKQLDFKGIHFHIGSQITRLNAFAELCKKVQEIQHYFKDKKMPVHIIDVGGGLGIDYEKPNQMPPFKAYFDIFAQYISLQAEQKLHFELGRSLTANCGKLISKVLFIKQRPTKILVIDAGMTELMRPALYNAHHKIEKLGTKNTQPSNEIYDVVGPICESSDVFGENISLPICQRGDLLAIHSVGAYGEVLASQYNMREKAKAYYL